MREARLILVTGATGFIGRRVVSRLRAEGARVRALVLPEERVEGILDPDVEVVRGSVTDRGAVARAVRGIDVVCHLAAIVGDWGEEELFRSVTIDGTENVLLAALAARAKVVLASSIVVYGEALSRSVCDEDIALGAALGPYSRSKQAQERMAFGMAREHGLDVTALRLANVYGAGCRPWVQQALAELRRGTPVLIGGGDIDAGLCYVGHAAEAFALAARSDTGVGRAYNICDGSGVTWRRYFGDLATIAGTSPPRSVPRPIAAIAAKSCEVLWARLGKKERPPLTREALNLVGSHHRVPIDRAKRELGFAPHTAHEQVLVEIAESLGN
jgi:2-alkyl-3-oxoalkanoate reductase